MTEEELVFSFDGFSTMDGADDAGEAVFSVGGGGDFIAHLFEGVDDGDFVGGGEFAEDIVLFFVAKHFLQFFIIELLEVGAGDGFVVFGVDEADGFTDSDGFAFSFV